MYKNLGLRYGASKKDIYQNYKVLSKKYHPDFFGSAEVNAKFSEINTAYLILEDRKKKRKYDQLYRILIQGQDSKLDVKPVLKELDSWIEETKKRTEAYRTIPYKKFKRRVPKSHTVWAVILDVVFEQIFDAI